MKFSDILKTVGLTNSDSMNNISHLNIGYGSNKFNNTIRGQITKISSSSDGVDRMYHGYQQPHQLYYPVQNDPHHHHHSHHPFELGLGASTGNVYYPVMYNMYGQKGYGLKLGSGAGGYGHNNNNNHHGGGYGMPNNGGYGHNGYSPNSGGIIEHYYSGSDYGGVHGRKKMSGSSIMTALTLLSFFFFLNTLQNCLKDQMEAMNPTVMVMTAGTGRFNRLKEITEDDVVSSSNSRARENIDDNYSHEKINKNNLFTNTTEIININSKIETDDNLKFKKKFNNNDSHFIRIN